MYGLYQDNGYGEDILFHFSTEDLALQMKEKILSKGLGNEGAYFVRKVEIIDHEHHPYFDLKKVDYYKFDGFHLHMHTLSNLQSVFLEEAHHQFLDGNWQVFDLYSQRKPFELKQDVVHYLSICRPITIEKEAVERAWRTLYEKVLALHEEGLSPKEINHWLKKQKK